LVWEQLLIIESELADYQAMETESLQALELFPQQPLPYLLAGLANFQLKKFESALIHFNTGKKFVVENKALQVQFLSSIGDTYHELNNNHLSDSCYNKALELDPENSMILNNFSYYLSERGEKLELADRMSKKAVSLDPVNSSNLDTRAWVLYKLGKYAEAKEVIKNALDIDKGNSAVLLEHFGDIMYKLGDEEKAKEYWLKAKEKGEGSSNLDKKVKEGKLYE